MRLIDADVLSDLIDGGFDIDFDETPRLKAELLNMIYYQETIDAAPIRRGKWIERGVSDSKGIDELQSARCSVCGRYHTIPYMYFFSEDNYCPHCGAKMEET